MASNKTPTILKTQTFESSNLVVSAVKPMGNMGGKSINLYYKFPASQELITVQTPWMRSYGINKWFDPKDESAPPKLSVTLSFFGEAEDPKITEFKTFLEQLDEWAIDTAHKNSWEWLKTKSAPRDTIAFNYTRSFKYPLDKETGEPTGKPANMKTKLTNGANGYSAVFFNKDRVTIPTDSVESTFTMGSKVRALIECSGFWVAAGKFGLTWKLKQLMIDPPSRIGKEYAFDDDEAGEESTPAPKAVAAAPKKQPEALTSNSDNEGEGDDADAPAPEPEPEVTQAKKVVRKVVAKK
jgi:hypothetical protein